MSKWKVGDRVKFSYGGISDTGIIENFNLHPRLVLIYMDNRVGHSRDERCWWVPQDKLESVKSSKTKRFL